MPNVRTLLFLLGGTIGALFLLLAARSVDWADFARLIRGAHPAQLVFAAICLLCYYGVKAERWKHLMTPFARATGRELQPVVVAGLAGNYLLPHFGEIARAILAGRKFGAPPSAFMGPIAIERFFDFLALLAIVVVVLVPLGGIDRDIRAASFAAAAFCAILLAGVVLFLLRTEACIGLASRMLAPISRKLAKFVAYHLRHGRTGLGSIGAPWLLVKIFSWSVLMWLTVLGCIEFSLRTVGAPAAFAGAVSVLLLSVVGLALPAAPGHIGTLQLAFTVGLAPFGVPLETAFAASVVYNVLMVVPTVLLGLPGLRRAGTALHERFTAR